MAKSVISKCILISILAYYMIFEIYMIFENINFEKTHIFYWLEMIPYIALIIFSFKKNIESKRVRTIFLIFVVLDFLSILFYYVVDYGIIYVNFYIHQGYFFMFPSSGVLYDISKAYSLYSNGLNVPLLICLLTWIAYYLEYSSFNISEDDSKKSIGKVVVLAVFRQIITRILRVLVAMALVGLLCPFILKIFF